MGNEAICDLGPVQFSLSLPETWDYEIRNLTFAGTTTTDAIIFWNIAYPEDTFTLIYAPVPGICGTGVTSEEITLPDSNLNGWKNTEIYQTEQKYWIYITLSNPDVPLQGNTLQLEATIPLTDWYTLETDFNRILETIRSPRQVALVRRKTVQLYRAGYGFRCTCDSGYSDLARTNSTCNSGETAPVGTKAVQLY